jgi:hypothetical protein
MLSAIPAVDFARNRTHHLARSNSVQNGGGNHQWPNTLLNTMIAGKYRPRSLLSQGTRGIVYRAKQLDSEGQVLRDVALNR